MNSQEIMNRFVNRRGIFAVQTDSGIYTPVRRDITIQDIETHLAGKESFGVYQVDENNQVKWGVIDFDKPHQADKARQIAAYLKSKGEDVLFEASGSEGHHHVWVFRQTDALSMRQFLQGIVTMFGLQDGRDRRGGKKDTEADVIARNEYNKKNVEVFPKTEKLEAGQVGMLVKLPLGFNRKAQAWSTLLEIRDSIFLDETSVRIVSGRKIYEGPKQVQKGLGDF